MRLIKTILLMTIFLLSACQTKEKTMVCKMGDIDNETAYSLNAFVAKGDDIIKINYHAITDYDYYNIDYQDIKNACDLLKEKYNAHEGIAYSYSLDQEKGLVIEDTIIDITNASYESLYEVGVINDTSASAISLKKTINHLKEAGFSCN